jgi:hypothetical protein
MEDYGKVSHAADLIGKSLYSAITGLTTQPIQEVESRNLLLFISLVNSYHTLTNFPPSLIENSITLEVGKINIVSIVFQTNMTIARERGGSL